MARFIILNYDYTYVENIVRFNVFGVPTYKRCIDTLQVEFWP